VIEGGVVYFIRADHIGRPVFATSVGAKIGVKIWTATYLPFGGVHTSTGALPTNRFPGQWFQSESGLHQNWMRDYDPTTGRYLQADPLGLVDGASVYGYVKQNPMRFIDPRGEFIWLIPIIAGILLDAVVSELEQLCSCEDSNGYTYTITGAGYASTGPFGEKGRTGIAGGGKSGSRTSFLSMLIHKASDGRPGPVGKAARYAGRRASRAIPVVGVGLIFYDVYRLGPCIYELVAHD
jgi:RHS repeat-associated protein